jgi:hypothetical protein
VPNYIEFTTEDRGTVLVEVEEQELAPREEVSKGGLGDWLKGNVAKAETKLDEALQSAVKANVRPFLQLAQELAKETRALEMEVSFGLIMTGEVGTIPPKRRE